MSHWMFFSGPEPDILEHGSENQTFTEELALLTNSEDI